MSRPARRTIASGIAAWDGDVDFNFGILTDTPIPIAQYALVGDLPAAGSYDECFALVDDVLYFSTGGSWAPYWGEAANVADSTAQRYLRWPLTSMTC